MVCLASDGDPALSGSGGAVGGLCAKPPVFRGFCSCSGCVVLLPRACCCRSGGGKRGREGRGKLPRRPRCFPRAFPPMKGFGVGEGPGWWLLQSPIFWGVRGCSTRLGLGPWRWFGLLRSGRQSADGGGENSPAPRADPHLRSLPMDGELLPESIPTVNHELSQVSPLTMSAVGKSWLCSTRY